MKFSNTRHWPAVLIALSLMIFLTPFPALGAVIFVRASATGVDNGTSWCNAYTLLQSALTSAVSGDLIWVARGTYYPTKVHGGSGDRYRSFQMKNGVAIYGGFAGTEDPASFDLDARDFQTNETVLSGDIGVRGDNLDNCYHVFYHPEKLNLDETAVLDGFTISGGYSSDIKYGYSYGFGAGMCNVGSSPTMSNCTFSSNSATVGGGMSNSSSSSPTVINCEFSFNSAQRGPGGGMSNSSSSPTVINCTFSSNSVMAVGGGGMYNISSSPTVTDCTFSLNYAYTGENGGGMYNSSSFPTVTDCTFSSNGAYFGGGMSNISSSPTVTDCTFSSNSATVGGGIYNSSSSPTVTDCTFSSNGAYFGGGMSNISSSLTVINCTFLSNGSVSSGGGMFNSYSSSPTVTGCTFSSNYAEDAGGGIANAFSSPTITQCILWGDTTTEIWNNASSDPVVISDIQGGYAGEGNISLDPGFIGSGPHPFMLKFDSPCINAGDPTVTTAQAGDKDLAGNPRISRGIIDMGAYEFTDMDGDGLSDYEEDIVYQTCPDRPDTDEDKLSDYEESIVYSTDPNKWDTDEDGFSDGLEVRLGFDPMDGMDHPSLPVPDPDGYSMDDAFLTLQVNPFQGSSGASRLSIKWQVCTCDYDKCTNCDKVVYTTTQAVVSRSYDTPVPCNPLKIPLVVFFNPDDESTARYQWQAQFLLDVKGTRIQSEWSPPDFFSMEDVDLSTGIADDDTTDLNHDMIPDIKQPDMKITETYDSKTKISVRINKADAKFTFRAIQAIRPQSMDDRYDGYSDYLPFGLVSFKVDDMSEGTSVDAEIFFAVHLPDNSRLVYYDPDTGTLTAMNNTVFNDTMTSVTVKITDGGYGDSDGSLNGAILHTSGVNIYGDDPDDDNALHEYSGHDNKEVDVGGVGCFIGNAAAGF